MVFAYEGDEFEVDLRHECTHALLNAALPVTPLWLDEGLAEYFEVEAGQRAAGHPHQKYVKWNAYLGQTPSLEDLEQVREVNQMTRRVIVRPGPGFTSCCTVRLKLGRSCSGFWPTCKHSRRPAC